LIAGQREDAVRRAQQALQLARDRKERGHEAYALRVLGEIASWQDAPDIPAAEDSYGSAIALADQLGMRPLVAHCHLGLGQLYRRTGHSQQAQEHLTTAITMLREMDMRFWLAQAEAELRELG
jgi:tetratricopeptide (TPR) repeat protein